MHAISLTVLVAAAVVAALLAEPAVAKASAPVTAINAPDDERVFCGFIGRIEELVLNATGRALQATRDVCRSLQAGMSAQLQQTSSVALQDYVQRVNAALAGSASYLERRQLLRQFRQLTRQLEKRRAQLEPLRPALRLQLISESFYSGGDDAGQRTEFDRLYSEFMRQFQSATDDLRQQLAQPAESLEILDEIAEEQNLWKKDKLYDEFIEMFLFKAEQNSRCKKMGMV